MVEGCHGSFGSKAAASSRAQKVGVSAGATGRAGVARPFGGAFHCSGGGKRSCASRHLPAMTHEAQAAEAALAAI